jgi:hypothetical protein
LGLRLQVESLPQRVRGFVPQVDWFARPALVFAGLKLLFYLFILREKRLLFNPKTSLQRGDSFSLILLRFGLIFIFNVCLF